MIWRMGDSDKVRGCESGLYSSQHLPGFFTAQVSKLADMSILAFTRTVNENVMQSICQK